MAEKNLWKRRIAEDPGHSQWYIQRFRDMAAAGEDLAGEARFIDAMVARGSRILDAGCGTGRVGGELAERGHHVVGVDLDPELIAAARDDHPKSTWLVQDLSTLDLRGEGIGEPFDAIVSAGNVMTFLDPATRQNVLANLKAVLAADGRLVIGFGAGRDYEFDAFFADVHAAGLAPDVLLSTWDLRPWHDDADFLVAVLTKAQPT